MPSSFWKQPAFGHPIRGISGDPRAIQVTVLAYEAWAARLDEAGTALKKVGTEAWEGTAADLFKEKFDVEPKRWFESSDHVLAAARELDRYSHTLSWVQSELVQAMADWDKGIEASRVAAQANPVWVLAWQSQLQLEQTLGLQPRSAFPGDSGAALRSHALWRAKNAHTQHDDVGNGVARAVNEAADALPMKRNFLENLGEFIRGGCDNVTGVLDAVADPGTTVAALAEQGKLWVTDQRAALGNLVDANGLQKNEWRWTGSLLLGGAVGKTGKLRPSRPNYPDHRQVYKHEASGRDALPGRTGGEAVGTVRGESLEITPETRKAASYLSPWRMDHIAERHGPNTPFLDPNTTTFPANWNDDKIFEAVQSVVADPASEWTRSVKSDGPTGDFLNSKGVPDRFTINGSFDGVPIRVAVAPLGEGIITAFMPK